MKNYLWILALLLSLSSCKKNPPNLHKITAKVLAVDTTVVSDEKIDEIINPYKTKVEKEMNQVLAYAPTDYYKDRKAEKAETNIGNFMADLCYKRGNVIFQKQTKKRVDFVLLNFGGIRAAIPKGNVTVRNAYEVMPFENSMVVAELSYQKLQELLQYLAKAKKAHPVSKQLHLVIEKEQIKSVQILGKKLDKNRTYFILTSDYLQHGGDHMDFFKEPVNLYNLEYKIRTAILDELTEIDTITAKEDGRVIRK